MKIAIINNIFDPFQRGGADKISRNLAAGFIAAGDEVFFIAARPYWSKNPVSKYRGYFLKSLFYDLKNIPFFLRFFWHIFDIFDFRTYHQTIKILKKEKPDLVITNNLKGLGYLIPRAIASQKIKHIHIIHDIQLIHPSGLMFWGKENKINTPAVTLYCLVNSFLFKNTSWVISPSQWLLDLHLGKNILKNCSKQVLANPIEETKKAEREKPKNPKQIIFIGEIVEQKGLKTLLKSIEIVKKQNPQINLLIIGGGDLSDWLQRAIKDKNYIKYLGRQDNDQVKKYLSESGIVVVPSLCYENSPTVIYEGVQADSLVVASRIGGITELVRELGGLLFAPGDEKNLAKKINYALKNYEKLNTFFQEKRKNIKKYNLRDYIIKIKNL